MQAESYKSTVNHELRTPLQSTIFILQTLIAMICALSSVESSQLRQIEEQLRLSMGQLCLMEGFIEDLLNMRLLCEGKFNI